jgi:hypothetical protein
LKEVEMLKPGRYYRSISDGSIVRVSKVWINNVSNVLEIVYNPRHIGFWVATNRDCPDFEEISEEEVLIYKVGQDE